MVVAVPYLLVNVVVDALFVVPVELVLAAAVVAATALVSAGAAAAVGAAVVETWVVELLPFPVPHAARINSILRLKINATVFFIICSPFCLMPFFEVYFKKLMTKNS